MKIFGKKGVKIVAVYLALNLLFNVIYPTAAFALGGGPSQPEVNSFEPVGTSEMVDLFSGDFTYNIPLLDVGGYPINISYSGGVGMDQEATWTGLGWNINPGVINRNKRGNADDWKGDVVERNYNIKGNQTVGLSMGAGAETFGIDFGKLAELAGLELKLNVGVNYNNYNGVGLSFGVTPSISAGDNSKGNLTGSLGLSVGSGDGVSLSPTVNFGGKMKNKDKSELSLGGKIGLAINSRSGAQKLTIGYSAGFSQNKPSSKRKNLKKIKKAAGALLNSGGASIDFTTPTYVLRPDMPTLNVGGTIDLNAGAEIFGVELEGDMSIYYSGNFLLKKKRKTEAYGYMYEEFSDELDIKDFNRENDGPFNKNVPNLPVTNHTYDVFSVSGQGVGGMYRPFRNDVGIVHDAGVVSLGKAAVDSETAVDNTGNSSLSISVGIEAAGGNAFKTGVNVSTTISSSTSGLWQDDNEMKKVIGFRKKDVNSLDEVVYFKQAGEKSVDEDWDVFKNLGGYEATRPEIDARFFGGYANKSIKTKSNKVITLSKDKVKRKTRRVRNQGIRIKTANEAQFNALVQSIESYPLNDHEIDATTGQYSSVGVSTYSRTAYYKKHHISEVEVVRPDGVRYVYGIPAYNTHQEDQSFAVGEGDLPSCGTGLVKYTENEATVNNFSGSDNYFDQTILPDYAHSYMLTAIVSADYIDIKGDGPTDDDLGTYTRFNYSKVYGEHNSQKGNAFKWRSPFGEYMANHNEGLKSNPYPDSGILDPTTGLKEGHQISDDKGSFSYGEKDVWYVHSVVTKNYVAEFELSERADAAAVKGRHGGLNNDQSLYKLNSISLFAKADKLKFKDDATPLKKVNFVYDYSLCKGIPNNNGRSPEPNELSNDGGKLTLKKIYFTYEGSNKAVLNSYNFQYSKFNPNYDIKGYDNWGNYNPNPATDCEPNDVLSSSEFPYTEQNKAKADLYASAWSLERIKLPSGGVIKVDYEADDYAFVQNKRAMEMIKIVGAGSDPSIDKGSIENADDISVGSERLYDGLLQADAMNNYLYFKLPKPIPIGHSKSEAEKFFQSRYTDGIDNLYFRFLSKVNGNISLKEKYEFVSGYADIKNSGLMDAVYSIDHDNDPITPDQSCYTHGYVELRSVKYDSNKDGIVQPISKATWQFTRLHLPRIAYSQPDPSGETVLQTAQAMVSTLKQLGQFLTGFNLSMRLGGYGKKFVPNKSWIRLFNGNYQKIGGGSRVKRIAMSDEWGELVTGENSFEYGQEYKYTKKEKLADGTEIEISSGVAAYLPIIGSDENPFRQPIFHDKRQLLAPDDRNYVEEPLGESFFPGASVGYSQVTVRDLERDNVHKNATGYVVHKFATAREFPTIVSRTDINPQRNTPSRILQLFKLRNVDMMTVSQGFTVELNDMHGKTLGQEVYAQESRVNENGEKVPISFTEYKYKTRITEDIHGNKVTGLDNEVNVLYKYDAAGNNVKKKTIGVDYDVIADMRMSKNKTRSFTTDGNLDAFIVAVFPAMVPIIIPGYNQEKTEFKSATLTKVVNRYSLVDEVIAHDLGSTVSTRNLLYDAKTGEVLLTETVNNYDDPIYSFTTPAHFGYDRMGMAYENLGFSMYDYNGSLSLSSLGSKISNFVVGDELLLNGKVYWVTDVDKAGGSVKAVDRNGNDFNSNFTSLIISRSGRRNLQTSPIGSLTTHKNPLRNFSNNVDEENASKLVFEKLINAGATEFTDEWKASCNCGLNPFPDGENEFLNGAIGNFRPKKSWVYLTDRTKTVQNNNTNIRYDGVFEKFDPFWKEPTSAGQSWSANPDGWQFTTEVSYFNMHGLEVENRDALGRYSAALYGYYYSLPTAVANNSEVREVGFDSFEDYNAFDCPDGDDHFSYRRYATSVTDRESHTGKHSIVVPSKGEVELRKVIIPCPDED